MVTKPGGDLGISGVAPWADYQYDTKMALFQ